MTVVGLGAVVVASGCAGHAPPKATDRKPPPPDMAGVKVMVLPAQVRGVKLPGLDAELAYWLQQRGPHTEWVFRPALERVVQDNPEWSIDLEKLAVGRFRYMEMERIGDPLYTDLRRLSTLLDARYALVPVAAAWVQPPPGDTTASAKAQGRPGHVEIAAAIIDTFDGSVFWYGVVAGEESDAPNRVAIASAAQDLARVLIP